MTTAEFKNELTQMKTDAHEMATHLGDDRQRDETILFLRQVDELLSRDVVTEEDMRILREHY